MQQMQQLMIDIGPAPWSNDAADAGYLRRLKCALSLMGLCSGIPMWPYLSSSDEERRQIEVHLSGYGLLPREQTAVQSS